MRTFLTLPLLVCNICCAFGQECDFPAPAANTCQQAPLVCDLDGYCSNNAEAQNSGTPDAFCGVVENNEWLAFLAGSETFVLEVTVTNCNSGSGLQAQILGTSNCQSFFAASNCIDPVTTTATLTAEGLVIGERYYLMIDGKGGDVCDYSLSLLEGSTLSPANAEIEPVGSLCEDGTLVLASVGTSPISDVMYSWSTPNGNIIGAEDLAEVLIDQPGEYQVNITDAGGCTDSTTIDVVLSPLPTVSIATPELLNCLNNTTVTLNATGSSMGNDLTYSWSTLNGSIVTGADTATPSVDAVGEYDVIVTDVITGCTQSATTTVLADDDTPVAIVSGAGELNCIIDSRTLDGSGSSQGGNSVFSWSTLNGNFSTATDELVVTIDAPGTYTLLVRNTINGCESTFDVFIPLNEAEPTGALFDLEQPCYQSSDGSIAITEVIGGIPPYSYNFNTTSFSSLDQYLDLSEGSYPLTIRDQTGCQWDTVISLFTQPEFLLDLGKEQDIALGCELQLNILTDRTLDQLSALDWSPVLPDTSFTLRPRWTPLESTIYTLTATDENGCSATATLRVFVDETRRIFVPNIFSPNGDGSNDFFYVQTGKDVVQINYLTVYNRWGSQVYHLGPHDPNSLGSGWNGRWRGELAASGTYVYVTEVSFLNGQREVFVGDVVLVR